jgi:hypothetical protein
MPHITKQLSRLSPLSISIIVIFAAAMSYFLFQAFAATRTGTLYTSPAGSQSAAAGQTFTVNVRINSGSGSVAPICADVYLSYPSDKLQVLGESYGGSPYTYEGLTPAASGGVLHMLRCASPGGTVPGGDQLFAQVSFKAAAAGSAAIGFTGSSVVTSDDGDILNQKNGVTYNISAPSSPAPAATSGSTSGSSGSTTSGTTTRTTTTASAGSNPNFTDGSADPSAPSSGGSAGTAGTPGSAAATASGTPLTSSGAAVSVVEITILDSVDKPVEGAEVTINGQTVRTDKNGVARFAGVPQGGHKVAVKYNGKKTNKTVQVKGASTQAAPQVFKVSISKDKFNPLVLVGPILLLAAAGLIFLKPWHTRFAHEAADVPAGVVSSDQPAGPPDTPDPIVSSVPPPTPHTPGATVTPDQPANPRPAGPTATPTSDAADQPSIETVPPPGQPDEKLPH